MEEIWKPIKGFEGKYEISNYGEVKSLPRNGTVLKPRLMLGFIDSSGYHQVLLLSGKIHKKIHRLVAEAFIPNPHNKPCVNHIDRIKTNNNVANLEWVTYKENVLHTFKSGYKAQEMQEHAGSKLDELQAITIHRCLNSGLRQKTLACYFNVTQGTISRIARGNIGFLGKLN
jgi:hypothetical protein